MAERTSSLNVEAVSDLVSTSGEPAPLAFEDFDDDDVYENATDDCTTILQPVDLEQSFEDCNNAIKKFFNNDLEGAMSIIKPWSRCSLYHSLGVAIFEFIPAMLTFDPEQIKAALTAIKLCVSICNMNRKQYTLVESIGSIIKRPNFATYSDMEAHAELCYAEALLLQAALTLLESEELTSLIKSTLKVKTCYKTYQSCWQIKDLKKWDTTNSEVHFKSGVRLGTAAFNLMISLLPPKIIALLEFVGFSGNKHYALTELDKGSKSPGMRSVLCDLTLLAYHLIICHFIGGQGDMKYANKLLNKSLTNFPNSVWFMMFRARTEFLQGQLVASIDTYNHAILGHQTFKQFRLLCYWELMWIEGINLNFVESASYAEKLLKESAWSKTTYSYIRAAMMLQMPSSELTTHHKELIEQLIRDAPLYKVRIAGKSLPMEKFVIRRCNRYQAQGRLLLPGLELMCLWNLFPILTNNQPHLQRLIKMIENALEFVSSSSREWMGGFFADNMALLYYIHGCALAAAEVPCLAIEEFDKVIKLKRLIKEDAFLVPYAVCEMAMCYYQKGEMATTMVLLNEAKKKYSGYNLESRLHFRVHARMEMVRAMLGDSQTPTHESTDV